jgi:hypothetical protein
MFIQQNWECMKGRYTRNRRNHRSAVKNIEESEHLLKILLLRGIKIFKHIKKKLSRYTPWRHMGGEEVYSSYSFLTSALDGGEWSASHPGCALPPGKEPRYPLDRRLGGPQSRSGHRG